MSLPDPIVPGQNHSSPRPRGEDERQTPLTPSAPSSAIESMKQNQCGNCPDPCCGRAAGYSLPPGTCDGHEVNLHSHRFTASLTLSSSPNPLHSMHLRTHTVHTLSPRHVRHSAESTAFSAQTHRSPPLSVTRSTPGHRCNPNAQAMPRFRGLCLVIVPGPRSSTASRYSRPISCCNFRF